MLLSAGAADCGTLASWALELGEAPPGLVDPHLQRRPRECAGCPVLGTEWGLAPGMLTADPLRPGRQRQGMWSGPGRPGDLGVLALALRVCSVGRRGQPRGEAGTRAPWRKDSVSSQWAFVPTALTFHPPVVRAAQCLGLPWRL